MNKSNNQNILNEIFEEEIVKTNENENIECKTEKLESKKPNILWIINKDTFDEVKHGVETNIFTETSIRITPAMYLAKLGRTQELYDLIKKESTLINFTTCNGRTALMFAAQFGNINCLKLLLTAGAYIDAQDEHGATALMLASFFGQDKVVKVLLEYGANKMIKDCNGVNAKLLAKKNDDKLICSILDGEDSNSCNDIDLDNGYVNSDSTKDIIYI